MRSRVNLIAVLLLGGCFSYVPVDGQPVFLNVVRAQPARDQALLAALPVGGAYWAPCSVKLAETRESATHVLDVEIVDSLPSDHAGELYTDGLRTRLRFDGSMLSTFDSMRVQTTVAHELGHAFGLEHVETDAVMYSPIQEHATLTLPDLVAFRQYTGHACAAPITSPPIEKIEKGSSF